MRILIKIGSSLLNKDNKFNTELVRSKIKEISELYKKGNEIILVSSGAIACGMEVENIQERPKEVLKLQLLSGEGQIALMKNYKELFERESIRISQILLTHHNFDTYEEKKEIVKIINEYLNEKVIPIINENDLVNKEELQSGNLFTDNDILAALVAKELDVNLVVILSDVNGLYDINPKKNKNAKLIEVIDEINTKIKESASKDTNSLGLGGMHSKITAADMLTKEGINMIIGNGNKNILDIISNKVKRTLFIGKRALSNHTQESFLQ